LHSQGNIKGTVSSNIDDRTLHEIYAWPVADMIHAGVGSVMCSNNQVNNSKACQNSYVLNNVLKEQLGFPGLVMSDWSVLHSGVASVLAGADMSMPGRKIGVPLESAAYF
jgi:beta-glucosidase-like glycosyl hydrolase